MLSRPLLPDRSRRDSRLRLSRITNGSHNALLVDPSRRRPRARRTGMGKPAPDIRVTAVQRPIQGAPVRGPVRADTSVRTITFVLLP